MFRNTKKSIFLGIFAAFLAILVSSCNKKAKSENDLASGANKDLVIMATNDAMSAYEENLGYAGIKYYVDHFDRKNNYVTFVDIGNFSTGNEIAEKSKGKSSIEIMKKMNYDIIVPGTHEFDYGYDTFFANMKEFGDKVISCNILNTKTKKLFFKPYKIITYGDFKVAYIGVTSPETLYLCDSKTFLDENGEQTIYFFGDEDGSILYKQVQACVDAARNEGANKVVLLSHLGVKNVTERWRSTAVIEHTDGIDAVMDAHSMELLEEGMMTNKQGTFVPIIQGGSHLKYIAGMNITKDGYSYGAVISKRSIKEKDKNISALIEKLKKQYQ